MPRPKKCRRICALPDGAGFAPLRPSADGPVILAVEEYEVIRLIDHLGCTQEAAAARMEVARTTVQAIYDGARRKLADALVGRRGLRVQGGDKAQAHLAENDVLVVKQVIVRAFQ